MILQSEQGLPSLLSSQKHMQTLELEGPLSFCRGPGSEDIPSVERIMVEKTSDDRGQPPSRLEMRTTLVFMSFLFMGPPSYMTLLAPLHATDKNAAVAGSLLNCLFLPTSYSCLTISKITSLCP